MMDTGNPRLASAIAAVSPPIPAPAMTTVRGEVTGGPPWSGRRCFRQRALGRPCRMRVERGIEPEQRRAIGTDDFDRVAHVEEDVRMIERRHGADAHELLGADLDDRN